METLKFINGHPIKRALICYVLLKHGPQTRIPLMKMVHALEANKHPFSPTSNILYFQRDKYKNPWNRVTEQSVFVRGLIEKVQVVNRFHVYDLTPKGRALAELVREYYAH